MLLGGPEQQLLTDGENDNEEKSPRPDLQRLIYRLSLLGIVSDYTVLCSPSSNVYTLSTRAIKDEAVRSHLFQYASRYLFSEHANEVKQRVENSTLEVPVCRCIDTLCWFIYEVIERRRRRSMTNMRGMLRDSSDGEDLAAALTSFSLIQR